MNLNFICSFIWSSFQNNYYQTAQSNVNAWRTHHKLIPSEGRPYFYKPGSRKTCIARNEGLITIILWNPIFSSHSILIVFRLTLSTRCRVQRFSSPWDLILQLVAHWYLAYLFSLNWESIPVRLNKTLILSYRANSRR